MMEVRNCPLVSIIIPAYNHASYLAEAIDSVLAQDYQNIELIVLDDGSTDGTAEVLKRYGDAFHWETHSNMGQANTLNKGWAMARGDVLSYLSADDVLLPHAVSCSMTFFVPGVVLTYCDFNLFDPASKVIRKVGAPDFNYEEMFTKLVNHPGPGVFFTKQSFHATGGWNSAFRQMPDYEYWLRLGLQGRFVRVPQVLAAFRVHEQSQTFSVADELKSAEPVRVIEEFIARSDFPCEFWPFKGMALSNAFIFSAQLHIRAGRYSQGVFALRRAFILWPRNILTVRTCRVLFNAFFNRTLHRLMRFLNKAS